MPDRDADGFGAVHFRGRTVAPTRQPPTLFAIGATVFLAVLGALCAHSVVAWMIVAATPDPTPADIHREMQKWDRIWEEAMPAPKPTRAPPVSAPQRALPSDRQADAVAPPGFPGLIEAQRGGHDIACLSGRISYRIPNGWSSSNRPCRATTQ